MFVFSFPLYQSGYKITAFFAYMQGIIKKIEKKARALVYIIFFL